MKTTSATAKNRVANSCDYPSGDVVVAAAAGGEWVVMAALSMMTSSCCRYCSTSLQMMWAVQLVHKDDAAARDGHSAIRAAAAADSGHWRVAESVDSNRVSCSARSSVSWQLRPLLQPRQTVLAKGRVNGAVSLHQRHRSDCCCWSCDRPATPMRKKMMMMIKKMTKRRSRWAIRCSSGDGYSTVASAHCHCSNHSRAASSFAVSVYHKTNNVNTKIKNKVISILFHPIRGCPHFPFFQGLHLILSPPPTPPPTVLPSINRNMTDEKQK